MWKIKKEAKSEHPICFHGNRGRDGPCKDLGMADHGGCNLKIGARVVLEEVKLGECRVRCRVKKNINLVNKNDCV